MNLTKYNPNNDRGITTQPNVSGLRCFDGEDLCKSSINAFINNPLFEMSPNYYSTKNEVS
jgi:hypothetical protein